MNKTLSFIFSSILVTFVWLPAHSQSDASRRDYKIVDSNYVEEFGKNVSILEYSFKDSSVVTREIYFRNSNEQNEGLKSFVRDSVGCGTRQGIFNNAGVEIGRKIECEDKPSKTFTIAYSHFDRLNKVNVISGESRSLVEEFVKGICPYAYHLYPEIECPGFD